MNKERVDQCVVKIREVTDFEPDIALILGSGLGALAEQIQEPVMIDYHEIPGFPVSTVQGHKGRFILGYLANAKVVVMQGRVHYYEGYSMEEIVLPTRVMARLGAKVLFLTNAAGGVNMTFSPGDFMLITDQISSFVPSPLIGKNEDMFGTRFPSMDQIYQGELQDCICEAAKQEEIPLQKGIYLQTTGPNYESPAEVRMFRNLGADAVGMSTAVEAIVACHMGMKVCGISCITNMASGANEKPLNHKEVSEIANRVAPLFERLVQSAINKMNERI